jgi:hypothetical protein
MTTDASGTRPPLVSLTVPEIFPAVCAHTAPAKKTASPISIKKRATVATHFSRNLLVDFKHGADLTPIPLFADSAKQFSYGAPPTV